MKKQIISLLLAVMLILAAIPAALAEEGYMSDEDIMGIKPEDWPKTMYVYTENGGILKVRSEPKTGDNVIDKLEYGTKVIVESLVIVNTDWACIRSKKGADGVGYVMTRFLVNKKPKDAKKRQEEAEQKANLDELNRQLASAKSVDEPFMIAVRATRTSGWINFRVGPGVATERIASLPDGRQLKVIGETAKWYQAVDTETGKTGYISKNFVTVLGPVKDETPAKTQMGKLTVNGEFALQCQLPEGYTMQLINSLGTRIVALVTSEDAEKPILQLSIAYDDLYGEVERMNDLSEEALKDLEATFIEMNEVEISYKETAYGTKLLIAKETGDDTDFVDILSIYKGYFVEFVMTPNPKAQSQKLSDAQIQMCIDFLSEVDFVEAK